MFDGRAGAVGRWRFRDDGCRSAGRYVEGIVASNLPITASSLKLVGGSGMDRVSFALLLRFDIELRIFQNRPPPKTRTSRVSLVGGFWPIFLSYCLTVLLSYCLSVFLS